jgi:thiosulfate/3-mercaptopyruvate sulfurtransferase
MPWTTLIDTETLGSHLTDTGFVVVDCRYDPSDEQWGIREYQKHHIPRAAFASIDDDLSGPKTGYNGRHPLPDPVILARTLGRLGIASGIQVVAYDQDAGMYASRLWWLLRWLGHDTVAVLDGGFAKWMSENRPVQMGNETPTPREFTGTPRGNWVVDADEVGRALNDRTRLIVDARAPERYRGDVEPVDKVAGRIPGAVNYFYKWNVGENGAFLAAPELRDRLEKLVGGVPPERVIGYCGSGVTACQVLLAFEHAGLHRPRLYPGSWSEWLSDPKRPFERG